MAVNEKISIIKKDSRIVCTRPWTSLEERSLYGDYRICCFINDDIDILKKDSDKDILDIWNNIKLHETRKLFTQNKHLQVCPSNCSVLVYKTAINSEYSDFFQYDEAEYSLFSDQFKDNRNRVIDSILNRETSPDIFPLRLKLHPSNTCNLNCRMCMQDKKASAPVSENYYKNTYKLLPYLEELTIFGGEPFACKITKDIIFGDELTKYPQVHFSTISNGTILDENVQEKLKRLRLGFFSFSLDSSDNHTYSVIRRNADFSKTMRNIESFVHKRDKGEIRIRDIEINFVIQKLNFKEIPDFVNLAHSLNIKCGFSFITGFDELLDCIPEVRDSISQAIELSDSFGDIETGKQLSYLFNELPEYESKIKRTRFFYNSLKYINKDKVIFFLRRHNKLRSFLKWLLSLSKKR